MRKSLYNQCDFRFFSPNPENGSKTLKKHYLEKVFATHFREGRNLINQWGIHFPDARKIIGKFIKPTQNYVKRALYNAEIDRAPIQQLLLPLGEPGVLRLQLPDPRRGDFVSLYNVIFLTIL